MLPHAILLLLTDGADHGYRLKQRLDAFLGPVWPVNRGQVYQVLERLRRAGWVAELPADDDADIGRRRWPVAVTPAGRAELARWKNAPIRQTNPPGPARHPALTRMAMGDPECVDLVREGLGAERTAYLAQAKSLEAQKGDVDRAASLEEAAKWLAIEAARLAVHAHLQWIDMFLDQVSAEANRRLPRTARRRRP